MVVGDLCGFDLVRLSLFCMMKRVLRRCLMNNVMFLDWFSGFNLRNCLLMLVKVRVNFCFWFLFRVWFVFLVLLFVNDICFCFGVGFDFFCFVDFVICGFCG